jgi:hypothetical protein
VRMAPSKQGSITPHGMADSAKTKTRAKGHKHGGACGVKWPMRLRDVRQPRPRGGGRQQDTGAARWQAAIDKELASCREFGVWEECELPAGKQALPSRFVLERKQDGRYKAHLVAGGHRQQYGLDFEDTFAPVCSYRTMRMILAVSAHENLVLRQFDVRTAFLNGELEEEVYVRPPPGAEHLAVGNKRVLRLRRALLWAETGLARLEQAA